MSDSTVLKRPSKSVSPQMPGVSVTGAERFMSGSFVDALFNDEPTGTFSHGHIFISAPDLTDAQEDAETGYWRCDIADSNRLTWSEKVYELFGMPAGARIERDWAVSRYSEESRRALERVRTYALNRGFGFILDAAITSQSASDRWIRVLAVPILADGRVVGLHGLKRAL